MGELVDHVRDGDRLHPAAAVRQQAGAPEHRELAVAERGEGSIPPLPCPRRATVSTGLDEQMFDMLPRWSRTSARSSGGAFPASAAMPSSAASWAAARGSTSVADGWRAPTPCSTSSSLRSNGSTAAAACTTAWSTIRGCTAATRSPVAPTTRRSPITRSPISVLHSSTAIGSGCRSVALNYYRDGRDSVAFHRDRELRHLDDTLVIIVTLGSRRPFLIRPLDRSQRSSISRPRPAISS